MGYFHLFLAVVGEVIGTAALKASFGFAKPVPTSISLAAYAVAFYFLALALETIPVGVAYAIWAGLGICIISIIGYVWFRQSLDVPALIGIGLILAGVVVINIFSKSVA